MSKKYFFWEVIVLLLMLVALGLAVNNSNNVTRQLESFEKENHSPVVDIVDYDSYQEEGETIERLFLKTSNLTLNYYYLTPIEVRKDNVILPPADWPKIVTEFKFQYGTKNEAILTYYADVYSLGDFKITFLFLGSNGEEVSVGEELRSRRYQGGKGRIVLYY